MSVERLPTIVQHLIENHNRLLSNQLRISAIADYQKRCNQQCVSPTLTATASTDSTTHPLAALVYATIFGNVTTILQQTHATRGRLQQLMANVMDFLRIHQVPKELSERVIDYVTSSWSLTRGVETQTVSTVNPTSTSDS